MCLPALLAGRHIFILFGVVVKGFDSAGSSF